MRFLTKTFILFFILSFQALGAFKIDRVIIATDRNPTYILFWPLVAKAWVQIVGVKPTLALIGEDDVQVDESLGDVIRFKPIEGVSTALYAQTIRILLPALFENEVCLTSDIDMLPLNKNYFLDSVATYSDDKFVVYRDGAYQGNRFPICYNAAKGSVFKEVFGVKSKEDIPEIVLQWSKFNMGWDTDEWMLTRYLMNWKDYQSRCIRLGHNVEKRIDRSRWQYDVELLKKDYYIDSHMVRPYSAYKKEIDELARHINLLDKEQSSEQS